MTRGSHARRRDGAVLLRPLVAVVVVLALAAAVYLVATRDSSAPAAPAADDCEPTALRVVAAPRISTLVRAALDAGADPCRSVELVEQTEREALDAVFFGGDVPDVWVPDGDWGLTKMDAEVVAPSVASLPVVLVGGPGTSAPDTWGEALAAGTVSLPDPLTDSVGTLAMTAPVQEARAAGGDLDAARGALVPIAQRYGELAASGRTPDVSLDSLTAASTRLVVTTEDAYLEARRSDDGLRLVTPGTGAGLIRFPVAVGPDAPAEAVEVADQLATWFGSDAGIAAVGEAGLRRGDGRPVRAGSGAGPLSYLPTPASASVDDQRLTWQVMSVPSSVLAVLDVSGSMDFETPADGRRIDVAVGAAQVALETFPGHARVGLWAFSIDQGGPNQDWRVMEPVRRLDAEVGGSSQRELLGARAIELADLTSGGTGLHDTALAAYRRALADYDPAYANSVILLTDGANDDPGSISEETLIRRLEALVDPLRPVRIIGIGISADADLAALERIAAATGGRAHRADTPEDVLRVFSEEIAAR